ncbi:hypothetical protein [Burkholderia stabilis]|uniref:hypothetical protein n=1 Tax=Burkholderia stabilis TaxID=95485 RepID=UPI001F4B85B1|nr:hypothetical protein [Burkholderia stabilis]
MLVAAEAADLAAPAPRNAEFLDQFIAGVARSTGRIYGQPTYERLLAAFQIARRPSAQTWSKAVQRAHASRLNLPEIVPQAVHNPVAIRHADVLPPKEASPRSIPNAVDEELIDFKARLQVAESALRDAYGRIRTLEAERSALLARASTAEAEARLANEQLQRERTAHASETESLLARVDTLSASVDGVTGLERHLRLQTDAMRQEMGQQLQFYKSRAETAEKALSVERTQNDAMRRILGNRAPG